jgi:hypothetical protein
MRRSQQHATLPSELWDQFNHIKVEREVEFQQPALCTFALLAKFGRVLDSQSCLADVAQPINARASIVSLRLPCVAVDMQRVIQCGGR